MGLFKKKTYKRQPNSAFGWVAWDVGRDKKQAFWLAKQYPADMPAVVVKTGKTRGKNKAIFPYTIFIKETYRQNKRNNLL